jgi:hypothetical protein
VLGCSLAFGKKAPRGLGECRLFAPQRAEIVRVALIDNHGADHARFRGAVGDGASKRRGAGDEKAASFAESRVTVLLSWICIRNCHG